MGETPQRTYVPIMSNPKEEHTAWLDIFNEMHKVFELEEGKLNDKKYRKLFCLIERWAWVDRLRRTELVNPEEYKGCLWNGEDL